MFRFRNIITALLILYCLMPMAALGKDIVLCCGDNGHIALEAAKDGVCQSTACKPLEESPHTDPHIITSAQDCSYLLCVDIPVSTPPAVSSSAGKSAESPATTAPASTSAACASPLKTAVSAGYGFGFPANHSPLPSSLGTHTSILRI